MGLLNRLKHAWNAFTQLDSADYPYKVMKYTGGTVDYVSSVRPDRVTYTKGNERSLAAAAFNRIAMDVASIKFRHAYTDQDERFVSEVKSGLNDCLKYRPNKDQIAMAFIQDIVASMLDEGVVAILPVDTRINIDEATSYDIESMRVGKITKWHPDAVEIEAYNDRKGIKEHIYMEKSKVAIIENPLYAVVNAPNSTFQRLVRKLVMLDAVDEQSASGKLDLIIQLPYIIKTEARKEQADKRKKDLEEQLAGSKYGIAYTDGTEKITQLNRPVENNLMKQVEYLTQLFFSQLGLTEAILNGTAKPEEMQNYMSRTIEPIANAIAAEFSTKFLTKTARSQGQTIMFFKDPFKLIPIEKLADIADKFTRNEIMSSNEMRQVCGLKPVNDPRADELRNKNLNATEDQTFPDTQNMEGDSPPMDDGSGEVSVGDIPIGDLMGV